ncbi:MAG: hypothetical protein JXR19_01635 [Bacteroidia bacterium]
MKKNITTKLIALLFLAVSIFLYKPADAQLTTALGMNYVFGGYGTDMPQLMLKAQLGESAAFRFRVGADGSSNRDMYEFYENRDYINHNDWPSDIDEDYRNENKNTQIRVVPGIELRKSIGNNSLFYYGLDVAFEMYNSMYRNAYFGQNYNSGTNESTITYIQDNSETYKRTSIQPMIFLGFQKDIGHGFSFMIETAVGPEMRSETRDREYKYYNWNGGTMEFDVNENNTWEIEPDEPNKRMYMNFEPMVDLFLAYTFGSNN